MWHMNIEISVNLSFTKEKKEKKQYEIWCNGIKEIGLQKQEAGIRAMISRMLGTGKYCLAEQHRAERLNTQSFFPSSMKNY